MVPISSGALSPVVTAVGVLAVIPARYGSTRFPGKPLVPIIGHPMIEWVYRGVTGSRLVDEVVVATDDHRISDAVSDFGGRAALTSAAHKSGSDRVAEIARASDADIILNVQGDEPLVSGEILDALVAALVFAPSADIATPYVAVGAETVSDPNRVKLVADSQGDALYFSRSPIPFRLSGAPTPEYKQHVGIYAYRRDSLVRFVSLPPSINEMAEGLEQLRALDAGLKIKTVNAGSEPTISIDVPSDVEKVEEWLRTRGRLSPGGQHARSISRQDERVATLCMGLRQCRLVVTDCDGVLTNGQITMDADARETKSFHVRDGLGAKLLQDHGIAVAILSSRSSEALVRRAAELNITNIQLGKDDKRQALGQILKAEGVNPAQALYIGDDLPDIPVFQDVGVAVAPLDAVEAVRRAANIVCRARGGQGVLREVAELMLAARS